MNNIIELYKKHINSNADGYEIHMIHSNFGIGIEVYYPEQEPWIEQNRQHRLHVQNKKQACIEWILKNSKMKEVKQTDTDLQSNNNPKYLEYWRNIFPNKTDLELEEYRTKWGNENPKYLKFKNL